MPENKVLHKNVDMVTRVIDEETILMPIFKSSEEINSIYTLNKDASKVWELIDGKRTLSSIKKRLLDEFDVTPGELDKEMKALMKDLKEIKAINEKKSPNKK